MTVLAIAVAGSIAFVASAVGSGPDAYQLFTASKAPHTGSRFTGAALTTFVQGLQASGYRSVVFRCVRGTIRLKARTLRVPVHVATLEPDPDEGGQVQSLSTCTWSIPRGVAGKKLVAAYTIDFVNTDGTTAQAGGPLAWTIRSR